MQITRFNLKEFGAGVVAPPEKKAAKLFVPGGLRGEVPPPPPVPTFSEEQLKAAERESYKKGFLEGTAEGRKQVENEQAEVEKKLSEVAEHFVKSITPLFADYRETISQLRQEMPKVALAIARKVAGQALAENAPAAVEDIAMRCVETMVGEPKLTVTVHNSLSGRLQERLQALAAQLQSTSEITVIGEQDLAMDQCRVEWKHGAFSRDTAKLWEEIERVVGGMVASVQHDTKKHMDTMQAALPDITNTKPEA